MSTMPIEAEVSPTHLLEAIRRLPTPELEAFADRVMAIRAEARAPHLSKSETHLLEAIGAPLPAELARRYDELVAKRQDRTLSNDEYAELLALTDRVEGLQVERLRHVADLAALRGVTLEVALHDLGLDTVDYE